MKNLLLASLISPILIGCGSSGGDDKKPTEPTTVISVVEDVAAPFHQQTEQPIDMAILNDMVNYHGFNLETRIETCTDFSYFCSRDNQHLIVHVGSNPEKDELYGLTFMGDNDGFSLVSAAHYSDLTLFGDYYIVTTVSITLDGIEYDISEGIHFNRFGFIADTSEEVRSLPLDTFKNLKMYSINQYYEDGYGASSTKHNDLQKVVKLFSEVL